MYLSWIWVKFINDYILMRILPEISSVYLKTIHEAFINVNCMRFARKKNEKENIEI